MKIAVSILTYNRKDLFLRTLSSLTKSGAPHYLAIVDNGSTDGTAELVRGMGGICNESGNHSTGYGMNLAINAALETDADIIVFSADDYEYRQDWLIKLGWFWQSCPADIGMTTCHLEPHWGWNTITEVGDVGAIRYAVRETIPGSNWTFRRETAPLILPIQEQTGGEDLEVCNRLKAQGLKLAALDLAIHTGEQHSAWGNQSWRYAKAFDYERYGFQERK